MGNLGLADWIIVGFSGHRNLEDPKTVSAGICASLDRVAALHSPVAAVSSAASGADTLFLEEVARRDIPFFLVLPFHRMRFRQDFAPADWQRVEVLADRALNVEESGDPRTAAGGRWMTRGLEFRQRSAGHNAPTEKTDGQRQVVSTKQRCVLPHSGFK